MQKGLVKHMKYYIENNDDITLESLQKAMGINNNKYLGDIIIQLISFNVQSGNAECIRQTTKVLKALQEIIAFSSDENKKIFLKRLKSIYRKILVARNDDFDLLTQMIEDSLKTIETDFNSLNINDKYDLINAVIEAKEIPLLKRIIKDDKTIINAKDAEDIPLISNIFKKITNLVEIDSDFSQLEYYSDIVLLITSQKEFNISRETMQDILRQIKNAARKLNKNSENYRQQKNLLNNLNSTISNINDNTLENIALKHNIKIDFDDYLLQELDMQKQTCKYTNYPDRIVFNEKVISVDSENTSEIDDAISIKKNEAGNYILVVHIADVTGYLSYESPLIQEAITRGRTIYLQKQAIMMFPREFSTHYASLNVNEPRLANSYFFEITKDGEIVNETIKKTIITNNRKFSYHEFNKYMRNDASSKEEEELITNYNEVQKILSNKFHPALDYIYKTKRYSDPAYLKIGKNNTAKSLIQLAMLLVNSEVAKRFSEENLPCIYRVCDESRNTNMNLSQKLKASITNSSAFKDADKLCESLSFACSQAKYDVEGKHIGLRLDHYCHATSPLRRAADLVQGNLIDVCYYKKGTLTDKKISRLETLVKEIVPSLNRKDAEIDSFIDDCLNHHPSNNHHSTDVKKLIYNNRI